MNYDKRKEQEAKKKAREEKAASKTNNKKGKDADNAGSQPSKQKLQTNSIQKSENTNNEGNGKVRDSRKFINNINEQEEQNEESLIQSEIKKQANDSLAAGDNRRGLLNSIMNFKPKSNQQQPQNARNALLQEIQKPKLGKSDPLKENKNTNKEREPNPLDGRQALLQSIAQRRSKQDDSDIDKVRDLADSQSSNEKMQTNSIQQSENICNNNIDGQNNGSTIQTETKKQANDSSATGDNRKGLMDSIINFKPKSNQQQPHNTRNSLLQEIQNIKIPKSEPLKENSSISDKREPNPPDGRQALLQSIVQRRSKKDDSEIDVLFPPDPSNRLLKNILQKKTETANSAQIGDKVSAIASNEKGEVNSIGSTSTRSVVRSRRSLGRGIIPDMDVAITTYDPS